MNESLISLSFDDGRLDNYTTALPILRKYGLPATFNITTGYVKNREEYGAPTDVAPMTMDMVFEIFHDDNYEIAGHGMRHKNDKEDIIQGLTNLKSLLGTELLTPFGDGFASPGTGQEMTVWRNVYLSGKVAYARVSLRYLNHGGIKRLCRKIGRVLHIPLLYRLAYQDTLMGSVGENGLIYSIPVLSTITLRELESVICYAEKHSLACTLMFHSIVDDGCEHDNWDFAKSKFEGLCSFLSNEQSNGKLRVCTTMNLFKQLVNKENCNV